MGRIDFGPFLRSVVYLTSLFYNTSARHEQHECGTANLSATQVRIDSDKNNTVATGVKFFDIDNDASKNIISHSYISHMVNEKLQGEEIFLSKK